MTKTAATTLLAFTKAAYVKSIFVNELAARSTTRQAHAANGRAEERATERLLVNDTIKKRQLRSVAAATR